MNISTSAAQLDDFSQEIEKAPITEGRSGTK